MNEHYRRLAFELGDGGKGDFLSGWQCENPFAVDLLSKVRARCANVDFLRYVYFDADEQLVARIKAFHVTSDGRTPESVLCGPGASPLLATYVAWLASRSCPVVYYVPPVYHSLLIGLRRYGISTVSVAERQPFESEFAMTLPDQKGSVLMITDPLWFCGFAWPQEPLEQIGEWQRATESFVFVDGSFQYLSWSGVKRELTSLLEPRRTCRLVNPCKQLAVHGYRFAYMLVPEPAADEMSWISTNLTGPASAESIAFAHEAMVAIVEQHVPRRLVDTARQRYSHLLETHKISGGPEPSCGYSAFCNVLRKLPADYVVMDGKYFDQPRHPGLIKINLLSPSIHMLLASDGG